MFPVLVLMFHGLEGARSRATGYAADPHYIFPAARFRSLLDRLLNEGFSVGSARDLLSVKQTSPAVCLSFDDGDSSNFEEAFPLLQARGVSADFFVNPGRVGTQGFMDWSQARQMAEAGQSIQSHGQTHTYFTHLAPAALAEELRVSKAQIEQQIATPVSLLAPPGGRAPKGLVPLARGLGYRAVLGSAPGVVLGASHTHPLPRVAITQQHTEDTILAWARGGNAALRGLRLRYTVLAGAKRLLGDPGYERLRASVLGAPA